MKCDTMENKRVKPNIFVILEGDNKITDTEENTTYIIIEDIFNFILVHTTIVMYT